MFLSQRKPQPALPPAITPSPSLLHLPLQCPLATGLFRGSNKLIRKTGQLLPRPSVLSGLSWVHLHPIFSHPTYGCCLAVTGQSPLIRCPTLRQSEHAAQAARHIAHVAHVAHVASVLFVALCAVSNRPLRQHTRYGSCNLHLRFRFFFSYVPSGARCNCLRSRQPARLPLRCHNS